MEVVKYIIKILTATHANCKINTKGSTCQNKSLSSIFLLLFLHCIVIYKQHGFAMMPVSKKNGIRTDKKKTWSNTEYIKI